MTELTLNRRQAVRTAAGVAAGSVLVAGAGVGTAGAHDSKGPIGSWLVTHRTTKPSPPETGKTVVSIIAGGVIISNDIDPWGPVGSGSWASRSGGRFVATFWSGFPAEGKNPAGTVRVQVSGKVSGDKVSGTFKVTVYPKKGKQQTASGTFTGSRLAAS
jgi:hypothetical protein